MAGRHFHLISLGSGLAARLAAALVARAGYRVLMLEEETPLPPFVASSLLERLLEILGDSSCLTSPPPLQLLTAESRLTFHGSTSTAEELEREFAADGKRAAGLLDELQRLGERLEGELWESGLPAAGLADRGRRAWARLRHLLPGSALHRPLPRRLETLPAGLRQALCALFAGLSLTSAERLSLARGALLWNSVSRPVGAPARALSELLRKRCAQFHGECAELAAVQEVQEEDGRLRGVTMRGGDRFTADQFLVDGGSSLCFLPAELASRPPLPSPASTLRATLVSGRISPLLAPTVILDGGPPLRLDLDEGNHPGTVSVAAPRGAPLDEETTKTRLEELFPFAELRLEGAGGAAALPPPRPTLRKLLAGATDTLASGRNLLLAGGELALPGLGPAADLLTGIGVARELQRRLPA